MHFALLKAAVVHSEIWRVDFDSYSFRLENFSPKGLFEALITYVSVDGEVIIILLNFA